MKIKIICYTTLIFLLFACQSSIVDSSNSNTNQQNEVISTKTENNKTDESGNKEIWIPFAIKKCLSDVNTGEPIEMATAINPFYLRADFDGNGLVDYALLVKGQNTKKNGLIICKDSNIPFVFGDVSKSKQLLSTFEDDDFITHNWDINSKEETKNAALDPSGKSKIGSKAKGESIGFYFDGGSLFIYWDGKSFQVVEGG